VGGFADGPLVWGSQQGTRAYAASSMWTGANVVDGSLTGADVQDGSLTGTDIQSGSITSGDLAPDATSGTGGATPLLQWDFAGLLDFSSSPGGIVTATSKTFNVAADGFVDFHFWGDVSTDAGACSGSAGLYAEGGVELDGQVIQSASIEDDGDGPFSYPQTPTVNRYLTAGQHTVTMFTRVWRCGSPQGSLHLSNVHFLATAAS
jgi:hypothetical protein